MLLLATAIARGPLFRADACEEKAAEAKLFLTFQSDRLARRNGENQEAVTVCLLLSTVLCIRRNRPLEKGDPATAAQKRAAWVSVPFFALWLDSFCWSLPRQANAADPASV
ncbi:unnamed protein product [Symbiodinium sp. CCMP2592]|nr:unnamed protein product [Symbiodinium sp. CCMP2592]